MGERKIAMQAAHVSRRTLLRVANDNRDLRVGAGVSQRVLSREADVAQSAIARFEAGRSSPSLGWLTQVALALGADLSLKLYPNTGPPIRDRWQAQMIEALLAILHPRWRPTLEVPVHDPVRGVIDAVLHDPGEPRFITVEAESELRRCEQEVRWAVAKTEALPSSDLWRSRADPVRPPQTGRILLLRTTRANREVVDALPGSMRAAYPAPARSILEALRGGAPWPGDGLLWVRVRGAEARILERRPPTRR